MYILDSLLCTNAERVAATLRMRLSVDIAAQLSTLPNLSIYKICANRSGNICAGDGVNIYCGTVS